MATDEAMTLRVAQEVYRAVIDAARERSVSPPALAAEIVTNWVLKEGLLASDDECRLTAHRELLKWVEELVERRRKANDWDKHVTRDVFQAIAMEKPELYARAIKGGHKTPLNREIGALVRRGLGAIVEEDKGQRLYGQVPRGQQSLIKTYTYLFRRSKS